jgi:predicted unusual protein kinase regulating ubiquinone biosynthesis (AarF/ABC1/UbiB family)
MRTAYIVFRLLPFALSIRRDFRRWIFWGGPLPRTREFHARRAERIVAAIAALGPTFVKLAQVFASRPDVIPDLYARALGTLTDQVPPAPWAEVEREIVRSYGKGPHELFDRFDEAPIAAGSLGQVYRASLGGREVVLKVLRPDVEAQVARDLLAARRILRGVSRAWDNQHVRNFQSAVDEFALRVGDEMDFRKEADHAAEIGRRFEQSRTVIVPEIVPAMTRQRAMVMEYVEGVRVDRIGDLVASGRVRAEDVVRTVIEAYAQMMLQDGLFHADPHPGNVLVRADGAVVLLDFGMCVRVRRETRRDLVRTVLAAIRRDAEGVVDGFYALGLIDPGADRAVIVRLAHTLLDLAYSAAPAQEAMQVLAERVLNELHDWPVTLPGEMVYFARAAALIEGLGVRYVPNFSGVTFAAPVVLKMRREILESLGDIPKTARAEDWATALGGAVGSAVRILRDAGRAIAADFATRVPSSAAADLARFIEAIDPRLLIGAAEPAKRLPPAPLDQKLLPATGD